MFSELVVAYLFLGGTGAGALLIAAVLMLLADERAVSRGVVVRFRDNGSAAYRRLFVPILVASLVVLVLGALCLAADVGRLDRILLLAVSSPSNYLVVGFWALLLCGTLAAAMLLVWLGVPSVSLPLFRALAVLLAAVSFVAVIYTGLLLSGMPSGAVVVRPVAAGGCSRSRLSRAEWRLWAWWQYFREWRRFSAERCGKSFAPIWFSLPWRRSSWRCGSVQRGWNTAARLPRGQRLPMRPR